MSFCLLILTRTSLIGSVSNGDGLLEYATEPTDPQLSAASRVCNPSARTRPSQPVPPRQRSGKLIQRLHHAEGGHQLVAVRLVDVFGKLPLGPAHGASRLFPIPQQRGPEDRRPRLLDAADECADRASQRLLTGFPGEHDEPHRKDADARLVRPRRPRPGAEERRGRLRWR